jgi:hypothetical protein
MFFLGFHPSSAALRYELATPLVFANVIRWMAPEVFRRWELNAGSAGAVVAHLDADAAESEVSVLSEDNTPLPFSRQGNTLHFFAGAPGTVRVRAGDREIVYSLTLPEVAAATWEPPRDVRRGVPPVSAAGAASRELWQILAVLGALCLLADWIAFGRKRAQAHVRTHAPRGGLSAAAFWKLRLSSLRRRAS